MIKCVRICIFIGCGLLFSASGYAKSLKTSVFAEAAILINAENGNVLFEKNADTSFFPASITKVATALYILDKAGHRLQELAIAHPSALASVPVQLKRTQPLKYPSYLLESGATHIGLKPGEMTPVGALVEALLICSANDAGNVLAEHISGSVNRFMDELNGYLSSKGFANTKFNNPHGLHHEEHRTTARDMAGIAREAMKFPLFRTIVRQEGGVKPETNKQPPFSYQQTNRLLKPGRYFYPFATGIKTGYISKAKFTLIASAEKGDRSLIAVLLGCQESDQRFRDAIHLFETAFAEEKVSRLLLTKEYDTFSLTLQGAERVLQAHTQQDVVVDYYPSEERQIHTMVEWDVHHLPIQKGQIVGSISLLDEKDTLLKKIPLIAIDQVDPTLFWQVRHYFGVIAKMRLTKIILLALVFVTAIAGWVFYRLAAPKQSDTK